MFNIVVDIDIIILIIIILLSVYISLFIDHDIVIKVAVCMFCVICFNKLIKKYVKKIESNKKLTKNGFYEENSEGSRGNNKNKKWLNIDKPLRLFCKNITKLKAYDIQKYETICDKLNEFSNIYYKEIVKKDNNLYKNIEQHKRIIQSLEELNNGIVDELYSTAYVTSYNVYNKLLNIPTYIDVIDHLLKERIELLKHKRKLR